MFRVPHKLPTERVTGLERDRDVPGRILDLDNCFIATIPDPHARDLLGFETPPIAVHPVGDMHEAARILFARG